LSSLGDRPMVSGSDTSKQTVAGLSVSQAVAGRRSCRSYNDCSLPDGVLDALLDRARRTPSAGNSQGVEFLVLEGQEQTSAYWDATLSEPARSRFPWPGLLRAPALVVIYGDTERYLKRYSESDKASTDLGKGIEKWPVPYWYVDAAFAALALQLLAVESGFGTCFFGLFGHEETVAKRFGVPAGNRAVGTVSLGYPGIGADISSRSVDRGRRDLDEVLHRGHWDVKRDGRSDEVR